MARQSKQHLKPQLSLTARKSTHRLYCLNGDGKDATWTPIGAAWPHADKNGFSIACEAVPLKGRPVLHDG